MLTKILQCLKFELHLHCQTIDYAGITQRQGCASTTMLLTETENGDFEPGTKQYVISYTSRKLAYWTNSEVYQDVSKPFNSARRLPIYMKRTESLGTGHEYSGIED